MQNTTHAIIYGPMKPSKGCSPIWFIVMGYAIEKKISMLLIS